MTRRRLLLSLLILSFCTAVLYGVSPWDAWRQGYTRFEKGEELRDKGEYTGALKAFRESREFYQSVRRQRPDWNQKVIAERIAECERECAKMEKFLGEAAKQASAAPAPSAGETFQRKTAEELRTRLADTEAKARQQNEQQRKNFESEIAYLMRDQRIAKEKYALLERRYKQLEQESRKPNRQLQELQTRLLEERMRTDQMTKQQELLSGRLRQLEQTGREDRIARSAMEKELVRRQELLQRAEAMLEQQKKNNSGSAAREQQLTERAQNAEKRFAQAEEALTRLNEELRKLQSARESSQKTAAGTAAANAAELRKLQTQCTLLEKNLDLVKQQKLELEQRLNTKEHTLTGVTAALQSAEEKNVELKAENFRLRKETEQQQAAAKVSEGELKNLRETNLRLGNDLKQSLARGEELSKRLLTRESSDFQNLTAAKESQKRLNDEISRLQNDLVASRASAETSAKRIQELERSLTAAGDENRKIHAQLLGLQHKMETAEKELAQLRPAAAKLPELQKNFQALQAENRENRLAAEAAKPREAELARIKLRLTELEQLKSELSREQRMNQELQQTLRRMETEMRPLRTRSAELDKARRELAGMEALQKELKQLKKLNQELAEAKALETEIAALKIKLTEAENRAAAAESSAKESQRLASASAAERDKLLPLQNEIDKLRSANRELVELQKTQKNEYEELLRKLQAEKQQLQARQKTELEARALELAAARSEAKNARAGSSAAETELATLRGTLQTTRNEQLQARQKITVLQNKLQELSSTSDALHKNQEQLSALQQKWESLQKQFQTVRQEYSVLQQEKERMQKKYSAESSESKARLAEAEKRLEQLQKDHQAALADWQKQQAALTAKGGEAASRIAESGKERDALRKQLSDRSAELLALQTRLRVLNDSTERLSAENRELRQTLESSQTTGRQLERQLAEERAARTRLAQTPKPEKDAGDRQEAEKLRKELAQLRQESDTFRAELEKTRTTLTQAQKEAAQTRNELLRARSELLRAGTRTAEAETRAKTAQQEILRLRKMTEKLAPLNDEIARIQEASAGEKAAAAKQYRELSARLSALEQQRKIQDAELARLKKLNADLARTQTLAGELAETKLRLAAMERIQDELSRVTRLNNTLAAERDRLSRELAERGSGVKLKLLPQPAAGHPDDLAAAGAIAEANGNVELAIWNYRQALKADPRHTAAAKRLGLLQLSREEYREAAPLLSTARAAAPGDLGLALSAARAYIGLRRFGNAGAIVIPLLKTHGDNAQVQLVYGLVLEGEGKSAKAEERLLLAARLAPRDPEPHLVLARLLTRAVSDRTMEAVRQYETARSLGTAPDPALEKRLGRQLDHRRDVSQFLSSAAAEAARGGDWRSAAWYYKQLIDLGREPERYVPRLAFARYMQKSDAGAQETLAFHAPSKLGMVVLTLSQLRSGSAAAAAKSALQARGAVIPSDWPELRLELNRVLNTNRSEAADLLRRGVK